MISEKIHKIMQHKSCLVVVVVVVVVLHYALNKMLWLLLHLLHLSLNKTLLLLHLLHLSLNKIALHFNTNLIILIFFNNKLVSYLFFFNNKLVSY